jgi:hypothetical protein
MKHTDFIDDLDLFEPESEDMMDVFDRAYIDLDQISEEEYNEAYD